MNTTDQIRELLAPYLEQVRQLAATRPDIKPGDCRVSALVDTDGSVRLTFTIFYEGITKCISTFEPTAEKALERLTERLAAIPSGPTRDELIARKRAELAELEGQQ